MSAYDFLSYRLYVQDDLFKGSEVVLDKAAAHYLFHVLRAKNGDYILVFNGRDGEWRACVCGSAKSARLVIDDKTREQTLPCDLWYVFAPLKHARLDYMVQKAVEMGVSRLVPVLTQHTQVQRVNVERMVANVTEAAEQCGILMLAEVASPVSFLQLIETWPSDRGLVFCDEDMEACPPLEALKGFSHSSSLAVMIGPEGGFSSQERDILRGQDYVLPLSLGPRILRADTAGVAALALVQAVKGDWTCR